MDIPILGEDGEWITATVTVRGLTRQEHLTSGYLAGEKPDAERLLTAESYVLAHGMVEPALTLEEATEWRSTAPGIVVGPVLDMIRTLSSSGPDAAKEIYKSLRSG